MLNYGTPRPHSTWTIDFESVTVRHCDGWIFHFSPVDGDPGAFNGECVGCPLPLTQAHMAVGQQIAQEAGSVFIEARRSRH